MVLFPNSLRIQTLRNPPSLEQPLLLKQVEEVNMFSQLAGVKGGRQVLPGGFSRVVAAWDVGALCVFLSYSLSPGQGLGQGSRFPAMTKTR